MLRLTTFFVISLMFIISSSAESRRLDVLFLGDDGHHDPIERYRVLKQALGPQGYNLTFIEDLTQVTRENLDLYDALIVYANHEADHVPPAILAWVKDGGALVALHSACGNFHPSKEWFNLIGGRFESHEGFEFSPKTVDFEHFITRDLPVLKTWDETYQHQDLTADRHLLQVREPMNVGEATEEPWTWTRNEGAGRVFYTASGHDLRCWNERAYQVLVQRAILWTIGEKKAAAFSQFQLPPLTSETPTLANRTHQEIPMMELQKPLTPAESAAHTQVPVGTKLMLFASEPMVVNPISIDWDSSGRAWVIESYGYPNDVPDAPLTGKDNIKILEDTNADGAADKVIIFAEGIRHCTTSVFVKGGVVITDGRDIVFLGDENGDGKSDVRRVLATGLGIDDTHASTSQFQYGIDNWIYATVGYSGVDIKLGQKTHKFAQAVFRFRQDLSEMEFLQNTTNNTWGLGFTAQGDVFGSTANNNPSWILSIPESSYTGSGISQPKCPGIATVTRGNPLPQPKFVKMFPNTRDVTQVDQIDGYTAGAGHHFYTDDLLADTFSPNNAFICEPTGHIVATAELIEDGSLMKTIMRGNNAFASADAWAAPVAARAGPDGALWIADWYDPIIQHNVVFRFYNQARQYDQLHSPFQTGADLGPGKGNAYQTPLRDDQYGRIWRIVPLIVPHRKDAAMIPSDTASLVAKLASPSQLIRLHAQRLLVEQGAQAPLPALAALISGSTFPLAAMHAVWVLEGIGAPPGSESHRILIDALISTQPLVRRHAMQALGAADPHVLAALPALLTRATSPREQLYILITASLASPDRELSISLCKFAENAAAMDPTLQRALQLALRKQGITLFSADFSKFKADPPVTWFENEVLAIISHLAAGLGRPALIDFSLSAPAGLKTHIKRLLTEPMEINRTPIEIPPQFVPGRDLYMKSCIECHQADGRGVPNTFPPIVGSERLKGDRASVLRLVLGGLAGPIEVNGLKFNGVMPGHSHMQDEELAKIVSFARYSFGGIEESPITADEVKAQRPAVEKRNFVPWTVDELKASAE